MARSPILVALLCICLFVVGSNPSLAAETLDLAFTPPTPTSTKNNSYIVVWLTGGTASVNKRTLLHYGTVTTNYYQEITPFWQAINSTPANATDANGVDARMGATLTEIPLLAKSRSGIDVSPLPDGNYTLNFALKRRNATLTTASYAFNKNGTASALTAPVSQNGWTLTTITYSGRQTSTMTINAGNSQTGIVHTPVATPPSVIVKNASNSPVSGITVTFTVTSGGGLVANASNGTFATSTTVMTNSLGIASLASWQLGNVAETSNNSITASASGVVGSPLTFTASATAGAATKISLSAGSGQNGTVGVALPTPPAVLVQDTYGNSVAGVTVTFTPATGSGTVTNTSQATNAAGVATAGTWTLGTTATTQTLTANSTGLTGSPLTLNANATAGTATQIAAYSTLSQSATVGSRATNDPTVIVKDAYNNPKVGIQVNFAVVLGGGSIANLVGTTNAAGTASVGAWTLGPVAGTNTVTATKAGLSGSPLTFSATGVQATGNTLTIDAGDQQMATVNSVAANLSVKVLDSASQPVVGEVISFQVTAGGGTIAGAATASATTDSLGIATLTGWRLGTRVGANEITASGTGLSSVRFSATTNVGAPAKMSIQSGDGLSATVGTGIAVTPSVLVADAFDNVIALATVTFTVASGGGSCPGSPTTTNAQGIASAGSWTLGPQVGTNTLTATVGGVAPVTFTATATSGVAASLVATAGDGQSAPVGTMVATQPSVRVVDAYGNAIASGVTVTFSITAGDGTLANETVVSDNLGVATLGSWTLGTLIGANTLTATATGLSGTSFTATAIAGPPAVLAVASGDGQSAPAQTAVRNPPTVLVTDVYDNPCAGVVVSFTIVSGGGTVTGPSATSNAQGLASVGAWLLGRSVGLNELAAEASVLPGFQADFSATALVDQSNAKFTASFTTTPLGGSYSPKNVVAVWIEAADGTYLKTVGNWSVERRQSLESWTVKSGGNDIDSVIGATRVNHSEPLTVTWDLVPRGGSGPVADGTYRLCFEVADDNPGSGNRVEEKLDFTITKGAVDPIPVRSLTKILQITINSTPVAAAEAADPGGCGVGSTHAFIFLLTLAGLGYRRRRP